MNSLETISKLAVWCVLWAVALAGCQTQRHDVKAREPDKVTVCSKCYDEMVKAKSSGGPRGGLATNRMVAKHTCEDCKTEMSIYTEQDVLMVKCAKCAPDGVPCDRCLPPAGYAK